MNLKMWINCSQQQGEVGHDDDYDCETFLMIEYYVDGFDLPVEEEEKYIKVFN